jgi:hypothetical protein
VTYPGDPGALIHKRQRPPCPVTSPGVLDVEWIPEVASRGWLIVTRGSRIAENRNEIDAARENKANMAALNQLYAQTKWGQLEVFMSRWRDLENLTRCSGPFIYRVSRTAVTTIPSISACCTRSARPVDSRLYQPAVRKQDHPPDALGRSSPGRLNSI